MLMAFSFGGGREEAWDEQSKGLFAARKTFAQYHGGVQQCNQLPAGARCRV